MNNLVLSNPVEDVVIVIVIAIALISVSFTVAKIYDISTTVLKKIKTRA